MSKFIKVKTTKFFISSNGHFCFNALVNGIEREISLSPIRLSFISTLCGFTVQGDELTFHKELEIKLKSNNNVLSIKLAE